MLRRHRPLETSLTGKLSPADAICCSNSHSTRHHTTEESVGLAGELQEGLKGWKTAAVMGSHV